MPSCCHPALRGETKPLPVSRSVFTLECSAPDGGTQTIPNQTAACTRTETQSTARVLLHKPRRIPGRCGDARTEDEKT
eukprot:908764-Pyramimonas_sp.AAC.2